MPFDPEKSAKLPKKFYAQSVLAVTPKLLGKLLVRKINNRFVAGMIVEVEAYDGSKDQSAHSFTGKTKRNEVMFREGGLLYVYFTYGMHFCCNVVTGKPESGQACLIRGLEPVEGLGIMNRNRFGKSDSYNVKNLTNGPAKICKAFDIDKKQNGTDLTGDTVFICNYKTIPKEKIITSKRIGIKKSVDLPWRYYIKDNPFVSKSPSNW